MHQEDAHPLLKFIDITKVLEVKSLYDLKEKDSLWRFESGKKTFLQTDSNSDGKAHWYLTKEKDGDPAYWIELGHSVKDVLETLIHLSNKTWVNKSQLCDAMLPAIRAAFEIEYRGLKLFDQIQTG